MFENIDGESNGSFRECSKLYAQYKLLSSDDKDVIFGGRLGEYKYYDMDKTIERAITAFHNLIG